MSHTLVLNSDALPIGILPLSVMNWQDAIRAVYVGTVSVVEEYEDWEVHSPRTTIRVPSVVMSREYVKFRRTVAFTPENLFMRDNFTCQYCDVRFPMGKLTYDHVLPRSKGGQKSFLNIASSCGPCNLKKGNNERIKPKIAPYRPSYYELAEKRKLLPITVPHASWVPYIGWDEDLVTVRPWDKIPGFSSQSEPIRAFRTILP